MVIFKSWTNLKPCIIMTYNRPYNDTYVLFPYSSKQNDIDQSQKVPRLMAQNQKIIKIFGMAVYEGIDNYQVNRKVE